MTKNILSELFPHDKDLTGRKFGRLTAVKPTKRNTRNQIAWQCQCACGKICEVLAYNLTSKRYTKSCGCLQKEIVRERSIIHGLSRHPIYRTWEYMKARCYNPKDTIFKYYGGRGISVCEEWLNDPKAFIEWALANGWRKRLTIERKDNDGNYEPGNCCWATWKEQANNKRAYSCGPNRQYWFFAYNLKTGEWDEDNNQSEFARRWGLRRDKISNCLCEIQKTHKSWIFKQLQ